MALNGTNMASEIVDEMVAQGRFNNLSPSQITDVKDDMSILCIKICEHIVNNLEVSGIEISEPGETVETYAAGVGNNGGSLIGQVPVNGSVVQAAKTRTQSNGGTGLVS